MLNCVSNDYELASTHSVKFDGFHSCHVGNPLAIPSGSNKTMFNSISNWPHSCPSGYFQHLVDVDQGCEIHICLENGAFLPKHLLPPNLPPFHRRPPHVPHWTDRLAVVGADNHLLIRNTNGQWNAYSIDSDGTKTFIETVMQNNNITTHSAIRMAATARAQTGPTKWSLIALIMSSVAMATLILVACMTSVVTCKVCCHRKGGSKAKGGKCGAGPCSFNLIKSRVPAAVNRTCT